MNPSEASYLSSGAILSLHVVVHHLKDGSMPPDVLVGLVNDSGLLGGGPPVDDAIRIGMAFDLLLLDAGEVRLSSYCLSDLAPHCSMIEPGIQSARIILAKILTAKLPTWIAFFSAGVEVFKSAIPDQWVEMLEEAELLNFDDGDVLVWWKQLLNRFHEYEEAQAKAIGDVGEALSIAYEKNRIASDNIGVDPDLTVIWVARLPGDHGYDVKSIRGKRFRHAKTDFDELFIEAKSSTGATSTAFRFYLTRNEWNTALSDLSRYLIYCWTGIDLQAKTAASGPFVIPAIALQPHIPVNPTPQGEWTECQFVLDLNNYAI